MDNNTVKALAIDLGASHGRVICGTFDRDENVLSLQTIHDFPNGPVEKEGSYYWDHEEMVRQIRKGVSAAPDAVSIGVDAWGHDFIPLDDSGETVGDMFCYRDPRTNRVADEFENKLSAREAYDLTGAGTNPIATRVQLFALKKEQPEVYSRCKKIVTVADYINAKLCGVFKCNETQVSMGGMIDPVSRDWNRDVLSRLDLRTEWGEIARSGEILGKTEGGRTVIAIAAHDTASALSFPPGYNDKHLLLSSGTWALVGIKTTKPIINDTTFRANLQVELGSAGEWFQINNLTGMWIVQELEREWGKIDYDLLNKEAEGSSYYQTIDTQAYEISLPGDMSKKIISQLQEAGKPLPKSHADFYRCILLSLCERFCNTIHVLEEVYGKTYDAIHVVGGGAKNRYFNQMIADTTRKKVIAGPFEATAIGNLLEQFLALGIIGSRDEAYEIANRSFPPEIFYPK